MIQIWFCRNDTIQLDLSKKNFFSVKEAMNYIPGIEEWKKVPVFKILESPGSWSSPMLPILLWKQKIIANIDSSTISPSFKFELICHYKITSWHYIITKSSIVDDLRVWYPPLVFFISMQGITKKIKCYRSWHLHVQSRKEKHQNKMWNLSKINNQGTKINLIFLFWFFYC